MNSKFTASRATKHINEDGDYVVCFIVKGMDKMNVNLAFEEQNAVQNKIENMLDIDFKPHKSKRSLEQNAALWFLLTKLAEGVNGSKEKESVEEMYCEMLEEANIESEFILASKEIESSLRKSFRAIRAMGTRTIEDKNKQSREMTVYQCFIGSSKYDTKQMYDLITSTLNRLDREGINDSEIESFRRQYEK